MRCNACLDAGYRHVETLLWNNKSWTAGEFLGGDRLHTRQSSRESCHAEGQHQKDCLYLETREGVTVTRFDMRTFFYVSVT